MSPGRGGGAADRALVLAVSSTWGGGGEGRRRGGLGRSSKGHAASCWFVSVQEPGAAAVVGRGGGAALYAPDLPTLGASGREGRLFSLLFGAQPLRGTTLAPACPMRPASRSRHREPSACSRMSHDLLVSHYASSHLSLLRAGDRRGRMRPSSTGLDPLHEPQTPLYFSYHSWTRGDRATGGHASEPVRDRAKRTEVAAPLAEPCTRCLVSAALVRVTHPPPPPPRARVTDQVTRRCTRGGGRGVLSLSLSLSFSLSLSLPSLPHSSLALSFLVSFSHPPSLFCFLCLPFCSVFPYTCSSSLLYPPMHLHIAPCTGVPSKTRTLSLWRFVVEWGRRPLRP